MLKKFKGYYFLSYRKNPGEWEVKKLELKRGRLILSSISKFDDIEKLKEISELPADTISKPYSLTKRQFKKFVKKGGFEVQDTFIRIKKSS